MSTSTNDKLSKVVNNAGLTNAKGLVLDILNSHSKQVTSLLGGNELERKRLFAGFVYELQRNPKILKCTKASITSALMQAASMRLYPGAGQECHMVPFGDELVLVPSYLGLTKLMLESGFIKDVSSNVVYENDFFECEEGTNKSLVHRKNLKGDRGKVYAAYAVARSVNGGLFFRVEPISFVDGIRARSHAAKSSSSPWKTDYDAMAKKTMLKQLRKDIPLTNDKLDQAIAFDNKVERPELQKEPVDFDIDIGEIGDGESEGD